MDELGSYLAKGTCYGTLSVKSDSGWCDYAVDFGSIGLLQSGPELLTKVSRIAGIEQIRQAFAIRTPDDYVRSIGDWLVEFVAIDPFQRTIRIETDDYERQLQFVKKVWEGWAIVKARGGPEAHFAHTGRACPADFVPEMRPPDPPARGRSECERIIWQHLDRADRKKADVQAMFRKTVSRIASEQEGMAEVAPGALDPVPSVKPGMGARIAMFLRAFSAII